MVRVVLVIVQHHRWRLDAFKERIFLEDCRVIIDAILDRKDVLLLNLRVIAHLREQGKVTSVLKVKTGRVVLKRTCRKVGVPRGNRPAKRVVNVNELLFLS